MRSLRFLPIAGGVASAVALTALSAVPALAADQLTGKAYAVQVGASLLGDVSANLAAVPVASYPQGEHKSVFQLKEEQQKVVHAGLLNASSDVKDGTLRSDASAVNVHLLDNAIHAKLIEAQCQTGPKGPTGTSNLVNLHIHFNGQDKDVIIDAPDQAKDINLGDGVVVKFNEQIKSGGKLTVNAVHVIVGGPVGQVAKADVIIGHVECAGTSPAATKTSPAPTSTSSAPGNGGTGTGGNGGNGGATGSGGTKLANTGLSESLPYVGGAGAALLALGGGALYWTRRRAANKA